MSGSDPEQPTQFNKLLQLARKIIYDERPWVKHTCTFIADEGRAMRKGWALFAIIAIILLWVCCKFEHYESDVQLEEATNSFAISNSFLLGQIQGQENQINSIQKQLDDYKRDNQAEIASLKTDNAKITGERDASQIRVSQLESLPQTALLTYSNADALNKMNLATPDFRVSFDNHPITDYFFRGSYLIPLATNREISMRIGLSDENQKSVEKLAIRLTIPLDATNIDRGIADGLWRLLPGDFSVPGIKCIGLEIDAQNILTADGDFSVNPLRISTNYQSKIVPARIDIFAPGINGVQKFVVSFILP